MPIRPMNDQILIQMEEDTNALPGTDLVKPDSACNSVHQKGIVLAVGPGFRPKNKHTGFYKDFRQPMPVKEGDGVVFVRFLKHTHTSSQLRGTYLDKNQMLLRPSDILLVFDPKESPVIE